MAGKTVIDVNNGVAVTLDPGGSGTKVTGIVSKIDHTLYVRARRCDQNLWVILFNTSLPNIVMLICKNAIIDTMQVDLSKSQP